MIENPSPVGLGRISTGNGLWVIDDTRSARATSKSTCGWRRSRRVPGERLGANGPPARPDPVGAQLTSAAAGVHCDTAGDGVALRRFRAYIAASAWLTNCSTVV